MRIIHRNTTPSLASEPAQTSLGRHLLGAVTGGPDRKSSGLHSPSLLLKKRLALPILAFLAALAVGLLFLLPGGLLQAQESATIMYPENGTEPVATFTAVDPEMTAIASWSLAGTDADDFSIEGGVLMFKKSPDFEDTKGGADGNSNTYSVTVQATDGTNKVGMKMVTVEVTNVDEPGMVSLSALQPQSSVVLTAMHTDPDGGISDLKWQWAKSMEMDGTFVDIENADSAPYMPADADIEYYLRATAMYTDDEGSGKSAMAVSDYSVQGQPASNSAPDFTGQDEDDQTEGIQVTRSVAENTAAGQSVGAPVRGTDGNNDVLTYTLAGADDDALFDINWGTGQIMTKSDLDLEDIDLTDRDVGGTEGKQLQVTVRATDPSGDPEAGSVDPDNGAEVTVMITVTDVNEPPAFTSGAETYTIEENTSIANGNIYMAEDPDADDNANPTWSLSGADRSKFDITNGTLTFMTDFTPNYEMLADDNMDNTYEVMVVATVGGMSGTRDVKVMVTNVEEAGTVTLNRTQPRAGVSVTATLTDPDGSISGLTWQWYRGDEITAETAENLPQTECADDAGDNCVIGGAMADSYTPTDGDVGERLTAVAMYTDGDAGMKSAVGEAANGTAVDTRNRAPMFEDQDSEADGDQSESTTITVEENREADTSDDAADDMGTDNIGSPINANDPDPNTEPLIYTLSGDDAGAFRVRQDDAATANVDEGGQIEVAAGTELDYEATQNTYRVTVTAEDSFGASDTIMVTILVTDMDEVPEMTGGAAIEYAENGTGRVATYTAVDPEMTEIVSWSLVGTDAGAFDISNGVLTFKKSPDYEMPTDVGWHYCPSTAAADDNMYEVTVQATDSTMKTGMKEVMVEVADVDEMGMVTLSARRPQREVAFTATLTDPDGDPTGTTWQWAKSRNRSSSYTDIENADSATYRPVDPDRNHYLRATAMYSDNEGSGKSAMATSEYAVQGVPVSNSAPDFTGLDEEDQIDGIQVTRSVAENTAAGQAVGAPVRATDGNDVLTYTLAGTGRDDELFAIDWGTGQIMTKSDLNLEDNNLTDIDDNAAGKQLEVTVRATDPSGDPGASSVVAANGAEVTVMITLTDVNEPPAFASGAETYTID